MKKRNTKQLTATEVKNAKPKDKPYKLSDTGGLYLHIFTDGKKVWKLKYTLIKENTYTIGKYPNIELKQARQQRDKAKELIAKNIDPNQHKKEEKQNHLQKLKNTFREIALQWHASKSDWSDTYKVKVMRRLENHVFSHIGNMPITSIKVKHILSVVEPINNKGMNETAHDILGYCNGIFRYARRKELCENIPSSGLGEVLGRHKVKNLPSIKAQQVKDLYKNLETVSCATTIKIAIKIQVLTFLRAGELRYSKWEYIDFNEKLWRIPETDTKTEIIHLIPLSKQVIALLKELKKHSGRNEYLFPSQVKRIHPMMSENTVNYVIKKMGFVNHEGKSLFVGHGFRTFASTTLNEKGFRPDIIEKQLAHKERNQVRDTYNKATYLDERRAMLQSWADYVDDLKK